MIRSDIIRMAKNAVNQAGHAFDPELDAPEWLGNFAELVAIAEREACAKLVESLDCAHRCGVGAEFAATIMARSKT